MTRKNMLIVFLLMLVCSTIVFALTSSTCGNNKCEHIEFTLAVGEEKTINVNGVPHTFKLDHFSPDGGSWLSIDGSEPMASSLEMNIFKDNFKQEYGFFFTGYSINREGNKLGGNPYSVTYRFEEESFCEMDCIEEEGMFSLKLYPGWNLVYAGSYGTCDKNQPDKLCNDDVLARCVYMNPLNRYIMIDHRGVPHEGQLSQEDKAILENIPDIGEYFEYQANWVYVENEKNLLLNFVDAGKDMKNEPGTIIQIDLLKGWNLIFIMPWVMTNKKLEEFKGDCEIIKAAGFEPDRNEWNNLLDKVLPVEAVGAGLAIKVAENCQLHMVTGDFPETPPPPSIPE